MKKILVPCDFSEPSVQAFHVALDLIGKSKGEILLLHVIEIPVMQDTVMMPTLSFEEAYLNDLKKDAERRFAKMIKKAGAESDRVRSVVEYGPVMYSVRKFAEEKKVDLIVMGTRGATGLKEFMAGSNTEKIVRSAEVPVIAVKKAIKSPVRNIVFPNQLKGDQKALVAAVKQLQAFFKAHLHLLFVNTPGNFCRDRSTRRLLKDFMKQHQLKDCSGHIYNDIDQESGVIHFTADMGADMVAMGTHGRKGLSHLMAGSIAEDTVNHIECPVWTYRTKDIA